MPATERLSEPLAMAVYAQASTISEQYRTTLACLAAEHSPAECCRIMHGGGIQLNGRVSTAAAQAGSLSCLRLAHQLGDFLPSSAARWAAALGMLIKDVNNNNDNNNNSNSSNNSNDYTFPV
jgi:hypothetical protein